MTWRKAAQSVSRLLLVAFLLAASLAAILALHFSESEGVKLWRSCIFLTGAITSRIVFSFLASILAAYFALWHMYRAIVLVFLTSSTNLFSSKFLKDCFLTYRGLVIMFLVDQVASKSQWLE